MDGFDAVYSGRGVPVGGTLIPQAEFLDAQLADDVGRFYADPLGFVMYAWDWENDTSIQVAKLQFPYTLIYGEGFGPDKWACDLLTRIGDQVRANGFDGMSPVPAIKEAIASGHGIGKSAITAWLTDWIMSTRPYSRGTITATTMTQLSTKTWAEIAKWTKKCITGHWFRVTTGKGAMKMVHVDYPDEWFCSAQTSTEENSEAFAGQHAPNATSFYIFDEASGVPDKIEEVSEGGLTDGEPMKFAFGNPTVNTGWFARCFGKFAHRWGHSQIDSRTVQITNKKLHQQWIDDYGLDSDFVKVRVRGMFPSLSARQFISVKDVDAAYGRHLDPSAYAWAPRILTCDPAWEGDDMLEIGMRQGLKFTILRTIPKNDNDLQVAQILADIEDEYEADAVFIDAGYGTGIYSAGKSLKRDWKLVWFGGESTDPGCVNKRMQMWKDARDWLKAGGSIDEDPDLHADLIGPELIGRPDGKMQLESKKDMKARGLKSPGKADALALSFAYTVSPKGIAKRERPKGQAMQHDPLARHNIVPGAHTNRGGGYDPFAKLKRG
ncbi:hypothetical protein UFOVP1326_34 [uncultured Caudovirales phage]|uniref:Terminase n=1 Tax=uncultured Caudovirales phage TaxID=2100421 RepID=A0A6J5RY56_9CAUD|nr:hypothetical protein UFOVP1326_34 [uncultured Caudovirales phage]CAB4212355.1 hypothetical protein UFOVP1436_5 [uncultured Caudovirales phage]